MVTYKNKPASPLHFSQGAGCFLILLQCYNLLDKHFKEHRCIFIWYKPLNLLVKFFLIVRRKIGKAQRAYPSLCNCIVLISNCLCIVMPQQSCSGIVQQHNPDISRQLLIPKRIHIVEETQVPNHQETKLLRVCHGNLPHNVSLTVTRCRICFPVSFPELLVLDDDVCRLKSCHVKGFAWWSVQHQAVLVFRVQSPEAGKMTSRNG